MPSRIGPLRSVLLGTGADVPPLGRPGFATPNPGTKAELERVATHLATSIDVAVRSKNNDELIAHIESLPQQYQGFAFEGAATGLAAVDSITPFSRRAHDLITGPAAKHDLTMYVGVGLAMGRIPRPFWRKVFPKHPAYRWLAIDGFGFYNAFFRTEKYIGRHFAADRYPRWMGDRAPLRRCADQGIGRALWFVSGGSPEGVAKLIDEFDASLRRRSVERYRDRDDVRKRGGGQRSGGDPGPGAAVPGAAGRRVGDGREDPPAGRQRYPAHPRGGARLHRPHARRGRRADRSGVRGGPQDGTAAAYQAWRDHLGALAVPA